MFVKAGPVLRNEIIAYANVILRALEVSYMCKSRRKEPPKDA